MRQRARPATPASRASLSCGQRRRVSATRHSGPQRPRSRGCGEGTCCARARRGCAACAGDAAGGGEVRRSGGTSAGDGRCLPRCGGGARRSARTARRWCAAPPSCLRGARAAPAERVSAAVAEWRRALRRRTAWGRPRVAAAPALPAAVEDMAQRCREPAHAVTAGERAADLDRGLGPWPAATCLRFASPPPVPAKRNATRQRAAVMRRR